MTRDIFTLIVAPLIVGLILELVERWLDDSDND